jgi:hypothetical protein
VKVINSWSNGRGARIVVCSPVQLQAVGFNPSSLQKSAVQTLDTGELGTTLQFTGLVLHWTKVGQGASVEVSTTPAGT